MRYNKSFETYLAEVCPDGGRGGADGAQEACERWIENLGVAEIIELAEKYGSEQYKNGKLDFIEYIRGDVDRLTIALEATQRELIK